MGKGQGAVPAGVRNAAGPAPSGGRCSAGPMIVGERLRRADDLVQVRVHELRDDVHVVKLGVARRPQNVVDGDDLVPRKAGPTQSGATAGEVSAHAAEARPTSATAAACATDVFVLKVAQNVDLAERAFAVGQVVERLGDLFDRDLAPVDRVRRRAMRGAAHPPPPFRAARGGRRTGGQRGAYARACARGPAALPHDAVGALADGLDERVARVDVEARAADHERGDVAGRAGRRVCGRRGGRRRDARGHGNGA